MNNIKEHRTPWIELMEDEDLAFIKRFILASGSLKALAESYEVSYPTVRLRLDRLIQKIEIADSQERMGDFERVLRLQLADGKIDLSMFRNLLAAHRREMENGK